MTCLGPHSRLGIGHVWLTARLERVLWFHVARDHVNRPFRAIDATRVRLLTTTPGTVTPSQPSPPIRRSLGV